MSDVTNGSSNSRPTRPPARPFSGRPRSGQTTQSEPLRGRPHPRPFAPPVTPPPPTTTMATPAALLAIDWTTGPLAGGPIDSGHHMAEEAPGELAVALAGFLEM